CQIGSGTDSWSVRTTRRRGLIAYSLSISESSAIQNVLLSNDQPARREQGSLRPGALFYPLRLTSRGPQRLWVFKQLRAVQRDVSCALSGRGEPSGTPPWSMPSGV